MKISKLILLLPTLFIFFLIFCFYPIIDYKDDISEKSWSIILYDRNWLLITDKSKVNWYFKKLSHLDTDSKFIKSLIKIEDKNYFSHYWVSFFSKIRAIYQNIKSWKIISWWSTITEQYIKLKYFQNTKRTYIQKLRESVLALYFSSIYSKEDILNKYLDTIYLWNNIYWLQAWIEKYFWKNKMSDLNNEEIVLILSLLNQPSIKSLSETNFSTYFDSIKSRLWFNFTKSIYKLKRHKNIDYFPFFTQRVLEDLWQEKREIKILTTLDSDMSLFARKEINKNIDKLKDKNVTNWALIALKPLTMEVLVYEWSRWFDSDKTDWEVDIISSFRQFWSTLKPFLYLQSLKSGANIDDLLIDIESEYNSFFKDKVYISENYSLKEHWLVRFKKALWNSLNNASVRLAKELWLDKVYDFYTSYGFSFDYFPEHYGYSLVLWNPSISMENLALSYINLIPSFETKTNRKLKFILEDNLALEKEIKTDIDKFLLFEILRNPDNRDISFWVNSILNTSIFQAVKTGTSSDFRDNSIFSYSRDLIVWTWVWNNDNSSMIWVTGISWSGKIWHNTIEKAISLGYIKKPDFPEIENLERKEYCLDKSCFRREFNYLKTWKKYHSSIYDKVFDYRDIFENFSDYEKARLKDLSFDITY